MQTIVGFLKYTVSIVKRRLWSTGSGSNDIRAVRKILQIVSQGNYFIYVTLILVLELNIFTVGIFL